MPSQTPGPAEGFGHEDGDASSPVERLETSPDVRGTSRRGWRWGVATAATVGVLGAAGVGAWAVSALVGGGPGPAEAVPADTLAYLALDLDPGAGQKVEAYRFLREFPALDDRLGDGDDLRRVLVEGILSDASCDPLTFDDDIDPWLGDRLAVALRPGAGDPSPFVAVQVSDAEAAQTGIEAIAACGGEPAPGTAISGDYLIVAEDRATAEGVAEDAGAASLAEDDGFTRWVEEAGGGGIVTGYVSADAPTALSEAVEDSGAAGDRGVDAETTREALEDFEGGAMVVRFDGGGIEVEVAASATDAAAAMGAGGDSGLADLPSTTALAAGFGVGDDAVEQGWAQLESAVGEQDLARLVADAEATTGLSLPEDLQSLLGDGVSVAVDSSFDASGLWDPAGLPAGVRIAGDPAVIGPLVERVVAAAGAEGQVVVERGTGAIAVGMSPDYVQRLAAGGNLGDQEAFAEALPAFDESTGGVFVDFDAGGWLDELVGLGAPGPEVGANVEPLSTLGVSGSVDAGVLRATIRLATD